jgi:hypothetical protein
MEDRSITSTAFYALGAIAFLVAILFFVGVLKLPSVSTVPPVISNGAFYQVGVANANLQNGFVSQYAITPAVLNTQGSAYVNGSAVYTVAVNSTTYPNVDPSQTAVIVLGLNGGVNGQSLSATTNFNNSAISSSDISANYALVDYLSGQTAVFSTLPLTGAAINLGPLNGGEYALEIQTTLLSPVTLKGTSTVTAGLFNLNDVLSTSNTGATQIKNFAFAWKD